MSVASAQVLALLAQQLGASGSTCTGTCILGCAGVWQVWGVMWVAVGIFVSQSLWLWGKDVCAMCGAGTVLG
jgi:hypothetical protein